MKKQIKQAILSYDLPIDKIAITETNSWYLPMPYVADQIHSATYQAKENVFLSYNIHIMSFTIFVKNFSYYRTSVRLTKSRKVRNI